MSFEKIIEIATERTIEQNMASIGAEYFSQVNNKQHLPIIGTVEEKTGLIILVADKSVHPELMNIVNTLNQRSKNLGV